MAGFGEKRKKTAASLLSAPQSNLVQEGEAFNPETAVDSLLKRLETSPGMKDNIAVIRYYAEHVEFKELPGMDGPVAYGHSSDMIRYNPKVPLPSGVDRDGIFVHEVAHQADRWYYQTSENLVWKNAIQRAESALLEQKNTVQSWFVPGGKYFDNAFFADIISALSKGTIDTPYSHNADYWAIPGNREHEIFANMAVLNVLFGMDSMPKEIGFESVYKAFKEIIGGGVEI